MGVVKRKLSSVVWEIELNDHNMVTKHLEQIRETMDNPIIMDIDLPEDPPPESTIPRNNPGPPMDHLGPTPRYPTRARQPPDCFY